MADRRVKQLRAFIEPFRVPPGKKVVLSKDFDPSYKADFLDKEEGEELLQQGIEQLSEFQARLAAQDTYSVLVCLQALDAAGKDGTIRHVMSGVNPQGVEVHGFKVPSAEELDHDYLWRYQKRCRSAATSASSTARTTRKCWSCASTRPSSPTRSCPRRPARQASGAAATAPSTTGSVTSSRTATRS